MIFSSYDFLLWFLPFVWIGFICLRAGCSDYSYRPQILMFWLLGSSLWFYAQWEITDLWVLFGVVALNFAVISRLAHQNSRWLIIVIVVANLSVLAFFKYWPWLDSGSARSLLLAGLPLGISFYLFQAIAFQIDFSRGLISRPRFLDFALFLSFFPQLIAGPIVHGRQLLPQLRDLGARPCATGLGLTLLSLGLAKKVLIADTLAGGVDAIYLGKHQLDTITTMAAGIGFGAQLYFDFSGYADMAVGLGLLFGIRLPQNFRRPYAATSLSDFWRRWHITLSTFLREYLYIGLGGNRCGQLRRSGNLLVTMTIGGLWHGAGWQFVLWGFAHGFLLAIEHAFRSWFPKIVLWIPRLVSQIFTLGFVMFLWIPFRASDLSEANRLMGSLFDWTLPIIPSIGEVFAPVQFMSSSSSSPVVILFWSLLVIGFAGLRPTAWRWALAAGSMKRGAVCSVLLLVVLKTLADRLDQPFLYFQF